MRDGQSISINETEKAFWAKVKVLVLSDTTGVVVMGVAVFVGLVVTMF